MKVVSISVCKHFPISSERFLCLFVEVKDRAQIRGSFVRYLRRLADFFVAFLVGILCYFRFSH